MIQHWELCIGILVSVKAQWKKTFCHMHSVVICGRDLFPLFLNVNGSLTKQTGKDCMHTCIHFFFLSHTLLLLVRHLKEIQELQSRQKQEIESLYTKLGKVPPAVIIPPAAPLSGRRRRPTKGKGSKSSRSSSQGNKSPQLSGKAFYIFF